MHPAVQGGNLASETTRTRESSVGRLHLNATIAKPKREEAISVCVLSHLSRVRLLAVLCTIAHQAPLSMGFSRQEYWSGLPCPPPGDLPDPGIEHVSLSLLHWQVGSLPPAPPGKPQL